MSIHIRWTIRRDFPDMVQVEKEASVDPLDEDDITKLLLQRSVIGLGAFDGTDNAAQMLAFVIYELDQTSMEVLRLTAAPGSIAEAAKEAIMTRLKEKLSHNRRKTLRVSIADMDPSLERYLATGFKEVSRTITLEFTATENQESPTAKEAVA
ncbi:MAG: hypothetical protein Greene041619_510 [Candidatus Peregrinibacteria bacterium Greene0416_19]|nr:MAG: hypothetical protein Greene041619_510 [Candidatus Peregrinibacteria bacterium Greene0416_19]